MSTIFLNPNAYLQEHLSQHSVDDPRAAALGGAAIGHVHLSVGDVAQARDFYVDKLGFEVTTMYGASALFVSAGGYHHHHGHGTCGNSQGAGRRQQTLGLGQVEIVLPDADEVEAVDARLRHHGLQTANDGRAVTVSDPWDNTILVRSAVAGG